MDLFNSCLLNRLKTLPRDPSLIVRPLNTNDYEKGFTQLLSQLTEVGSIGEDQFLSRFAKMKNAGGYYVIVIEDRNIGKIIGSATLVVEQKFIHNCGLRGRLEDVVVNSTYRGQQLGKILVMAVTQLSRQLKCYKLSLDCKDKLVPFYESLGFKLEPGNANQMNVRFPANQAEQSHL
ncbi:probable glucosamine 6-phosphate N-acetyltransferase isoform X2 [Leptopilina boulardi]|nr:probable glucosamine 6-phosphate N-acetyltransferase isoform X2 [Leptopilina boulardi]